MKTSKWLMGSVAVLACLFVTEASLAMAGASAQYNPCRAWVMHAPGGVPGYKCEGDLCAAGFPLCQKEETYGPGWVYLRCVCRNMDGETYDGEEPNRLCTEFFQYDQVALMFYVSCVEVHCASDCDALGGTLPTTWTLVCDCI